MEEEKLYMVMDDTDAIAEKGYNMDEFETEADKKFFDDLLKKVKKEFNL